MLDRWIECFKTRQVISKSGLAGRTQMQTVSIPDKGSYFIKTYFRGGMVRRFLKRKYLRTGKTRARLEFEINTRVQKLGVSVPEPVAFAHQGTMFYQCWLISRQIEDSRTLAEFYASDWERARRIMPRIARQVGKLIENRILHVDFHPGNVLVAPDRVYLIDFDKGRIFNGTQDKLIARYRERWDRAVLKYNLPPLLTGDFRDEMAKVFNQNQKKNEPY